MKITHTFLVLLVLACLLQTSSGAMTLICPDAFCTFTNTSAQITYMTTLCASVPTNNLGLCNTTCSQCSSSAPNDCISCSTGYVLSGKYCMLDNSIKNYSIYTYAGNNLLIDQSTIAAFQYSKTNQPLTTTDILSSCQNTTSSSYEFVSAGLFKTTDIVQLPYSFTDPIDKIQIKFNFKSVVASMKLFITLNDNVLYSKQFTGFSDLTGTYTTNHSDATTRNFLELPSMTSSNINSVWVTVDTGLIDYIVSSFTLKFYVQSNNT